MEKQLQLIFCIAAIQRHACQKVTQHYNSCNWSTCSSEETPKSIMPKRSRDKGTEQFCQKLIKETANKVTGKLKRLWNEYFENQQILQEKKLRFRMTLTRPEKKEIAQNYAPVGLNLSLSILVLLFKTSFVCFVLSHVRFLTSQMRHTRYFRLSQ